MLTHEVNIKQFCLKCLHILVQSRSGKSLNTLCDYEGKTTWFNLSIPEDRSAQKMFNEVIVKDGVINFNQPILINFFVRYRSTRTQIESWCISMHQINAAVSNQSKNSRSSSYAALTLLLKSVLCISRITPGYRFAKNQKKENYCMEYEIQRECSIPRKIKKTSEKLLEIGSVETKIAILKLSVTHKTEDFFQNFNQNLSDSITSNSDQLHSSNQHINIITSRVRTISENDLNNDTPPSLLGDSTFNSPSFNTSESKVSQNTNSRFVQSSIKFRVGSPSSQISARSPPQFRTGSPSQQFRIGSPSSRHMNSSSIAQSPLACSPINNYLQETASNVSLPLFGGSPTSQNNTNYSLPWNINESQSEVIKSKNQSVRCRTGFEIIDSSSQNLYKNKDNPSSGDFDTCFLLPNDLINKPIKTDENDVVSGFKKLIDEALAHQTAVRKFFNSPLIAHKSINEESYDKNQIKSLSTNNDKLESSSEIIDILQEHHLPFANKEKISPLNKFYVDNKKMKKYCESFSKLKSEETYEQVREEAENYIQEKNEFDDFINSLK